MNVSERCSCGATLDISEIRENDINSTLRMTVADFRVGHRCTVSKEEETIAPSGVPF